MTLTRFELCTFGSQRDKTRSAQSKSSSRGSQDKRETMARRAARGEVVEVGASVVLIFALFETENNILSLALLY